MTSKDKINWIYYPRSSPLPTFGISIVKIFKDFADSIDSTKSLIQHSNVVMARLRPELEKIGFRVEKGKSSEGKIDVPVLYGSNGKIDKRFNADAYAETDHWVLEIEAGRAVANNQFLKDIFQACMTLFILR